MNILQLNSQAVINIADLFFKKFITRNNWNNTHKIKGIMSHQMQRKLTNCYFFCERNDKNTTFPIRLKYFYGLNDKTKANTKQS